jgi:hypothetical protein
MGFRSPLDFNSVSHQIHMAGVEVSSPFNDGFVSWPIKQNLYRLKWLLDEILVASPTFSDEQEFVEEHSKTKMWRVLKK